MLRLWLSLTMVFVLAVGATSAQDPPKKEGVDEKPAAEKKEKKPPLTDAQKAELAKKRAAAMEKMFKAKDKNGDGKLTFEEFKGKVKKAEVLERIEKRFKAVDKNADGAVTLEEMKAKPERKEKPKKKPAGDKPKKEKGPKKGKKPAEG